MLGATRLHWADRRVSVAIPDSLSDARMAGVGASCPFPWMLANVPSQSPQQPFAAGNGTGVPRPELIDLLPGKPPGWPAVIAATSALSGATGTAPAQLLNGATGEMRHKWHLTMMEGIINLGQVR